MDEGFAYSQVSASQDSLPSFLPVTSPPPVHAIALTQISKNVHELTLPTNDSPSPYCFWPPDFGTVVVEIQHTLPPVEPMKSMESAPLIHAKPQFYYEGIGYCSLSEAACGSLLEQFVPDFQVKFGHTYQVPLGNGRSADFAIGDVLIEYHPLRFRSERGRFGDFPDKDSYSRFHKELRKTRGNRSQTKRLIAKTTEQLKSHYQAKRERTIAASPGGAEKELVVASTFEEFYFAVLRRFSRGACPSLKKAQYLFHEAVRHIARQRRKVRGKR